MYERRALMTLDVTYDTPASVVEQIPVMMKQIVDAQTSVRFERSHFASFGESALRIETVYFVLDPEYARFMDVQPAVNLEVLRRFNAQGIRFAFPTRTVHYNEAPKKAVG
jgi:small-conductance mechanosensitive channel